jgi:HlyD family secretion protein
MKRLVLVVLALVAVVIAVRMIWFGERRIEVEAVVVATGPVEDVVTNSESGTVKARGQVRLSAERAGTVAAIPHREGSTVRRDDVLVALEPAAARLHGDAAGRELDAARSTLAAARANESLAAKTHERAVRLRAQGLASQEAEDEARSRLDAARAERRAAEARVAAARAAVKLAADDITHQTIVAPFDGVVARRLVEVGETVVAGQPVVDLADPNRLYVSCPMDERDAGRLRVGLPARVTVDAYPGRTWSGTVTWVAPLVEEAREENRTLTVEIELATAPDAPALRPGMTADAEVVISRREGVLRAPSFALMDGKRVFAVRGGRAVSVEVSTGLRNWDWTEITGGLTAGERVITTLDRTGLAAGVAVAVADSS